jgi:hypothetical protein
MNGYYLVAFQMFEDKESATRCAKFLREQAREHELCYRIDEEGDYFRDDRYTSGRVWVHEVEFKDAWAKS